MWPYSAQAAFYIIMSFFPFIMFLLTLLQFLPFSRDELVAAMEYIVPAAVADYVIPIIDEAFQNASGVVLSITIVAVLWPASRGTVAIKDGLNRVYHVKERRFYGLVRAMSIGYIILFSLAIILLLGLYVLGERLVDHFGRLFPGIDDLLIRILSFRLVVSVAFLTLVFTLIYMLLPNRKSSLIKELPGAILASFGWIFFSYLFSYYIDNLSNMSATYGSLTTIILCMIWLEFCMFILFMGAEVNYFLCGEFYRNIKAKLSERKKGKKRFRRMKREVSLVFTGDIGFDKYMSGKWDDETFVSPKVQEFLSSGDHLIINVEGPLSEGNKNSVSGSANQLVHSMSPKAADFFDSLGADIWNICNNHIMDAGAQGMEDTLENASKHGVKTLGAGMNLEEASKPIYMNDAGGIGILAVGYSRACRLAGDNTPGCLNWSAMELVEQKIAEIKKNCRWCIIVAHDGEEFTALPSPYTRERYMHYLDMGADIVVAHHPHVPMNYETFPGKAIFYSLGNFIFDTDYQRSQFNTESGIVLKLKLTEKDFEVEPFGIKIDREKGRIIASELPEIFQDVQEDEYKMLLPLAAKVFVENTKRQLRYMKPEAFANASEEDFRENFYEPMRSGRVPGEILDMQIMYPLSQEAGKEAYKESKLDSVKQFMLRQL